jgi:hypothetical protein
VRTARSPEKRPGPSTETSREIVFWRSDTGFGYRRCGSRQGLRVNRSERRADSIA